MQQFFSVNDDVIISEGIHVRITEIQKTCKKMDAHVAV